MTFCLENVYKKLTQFFLEFFSFSDTSEHIKIETL